MSKKSSKVEKTNNVRFMVRDWKEQLSAKELTQKIKEVQAICPGQDVVVEDNWQTGGDSLLTVITVAPKDAFDPRQGEELIDLTGIDCEVHYDGKEFWFKYPGHEWLDMKEAEKVYQWLCLLEEADGDPVKAEQLYQWLCLLEEADGDPVKAEQLRKESEEDAKQ